MIKLEKNFLPSYISTPTALLFSIIISFASALTKIVPPDFSITLSIDLAISEDPPTGKLPPLK